MTERKAGFLGLEKSHFQRLKKTEIDSGKNYFSHHMPLKLTQNITFILITKMYSTFSFQKKDAAHYCYKLAVKQNLLISETKQKCLKYKNRSVSVGFH